MESLADISSSWTEEEEVEHERRANAEDAIYALPEHERDTAWTEEYKKRAEWDRRRLSIQVAEQQAQADHPTSSVTDPHGDKNNLQLSVSSNMDERSSMSLRRICVVRFWKK